jgi:hypothetical protein
MPSLAEKIQAAKICCRKVGDYFAEKKKSFAEKLFECEWEELVIRRDEQTGKPFGKLVCCLKRLS